MSLQEIWFQTSCKKTKPTRMIAYDRVEMEGGGGGGGGWPRIKNRED